jgi:phage host-nuclease inhibitor protein Gam
MITTHTPLTTALATAKAATILARALIAEMDAELAAIKAKFEGKIKTRTDELGAAIKAAQVYADAHRKELLNGGGKSLELNGHTLGWRDTPAAIKCVKGTTERKLLERLMRETQLRRLFVRTKPTLNKEAMQDRWSRFKAKLTKLGARLVTTEYFFVELDVTADPAAKP